MDHGLFGPTYKEALTWEGQRYQKKYLPIWYPVIQSCVMFSQSFHDNLLQLCKFMIQGLLMRLILPMIAFVMHVNQLIYDRIIVSWIKAMFLFLRSFHQTRSWIHRNHNS
jgi:hypothetical protein